MGDVVTICSVLPDLLGTYGDGGNITVLADRLRRRAIAYEVIEVRAGESVPSSADLYALGGGEGSAQEVAAGLLLSSSLSEVVSRGAAVLAVCAGLQILGDYFPGHDGQRSVGLGVVDCATDAGAPRIVGEVVATASPDLGLPTLYGFENHGGRTTLGAGVAPLAVVSVGTGNGDGTRYEGYMCEGVVGTYLHGPVLARNPALADLLLARVVGPLQPLDDRLYDAVRAERAAAVRGQHREAATGRRGRLFGRGN